MGKQRPTQRRHSVSQDTPPARAGYPRSKSPAANEPALEYIFHPRSVALVGAATDPAHWFINDFYIDPLIKFGYTGQIYAVNA